MNTNRIVFSLLSLAFATGMRPVNSPYPGADREANALYRSVTAETTEMDPATAYISTYIFDVLEPPFVYHLLKRPLELTPLTATSIPEPEERVLTVEGKEVKAIVYRIDIKKGILYQDHPCFAPANHGLTAKAVAELRTVRDLPLKGTRELKAADFVLGVCRLADSRLECPIYNILEKNMLGLVEYKDRLEKVLETERVKRKAAAGIGYNREADEKYAPIPVDYFELARGLPFVKETGPYSFELALKHPYPQILAWLTFSFFAPVPQETLDFYSQPVLLERSFSLENDIVGTGPYVLEVSDPIHQIVMTRNRNFRHEVYPSLPEPDPDDAQAVANYRYMKSAGMLEDCGRKLPFIDKVVYRIEKESIPRWNKFVQGYYDESSIEAELFDETVQLSSEGGSILTPELERRNVRMIQAMPAITGWIEFNMGDDVVGGYTEDACKLRRALSIAYDSEEEIELLKNGIGIVAQSIIPPGIFGQTTDRAGMNRCVFDWDEEAGRPVRKPVEEAKKLLAEAGYRDGVDASGQPLVLDYMIGAMNTSTRAQITFLRRQFEKINVGLKITLVDGNRFHKKREAGTFQLCGCGWAADYPDPENFLFLYNNHPPGEGMNKTGYRYHRPQYNELYLKMQCLPDSPERLAVIREMLGMLSHDAPSIFKMHPVKYSLYHGWLRNATPEVRCDRIKYIRLDLEARRAYREKYNQPQWGKVALFVLGVMAFATPAMVAGIRRLRGA
jgi:oligopeptide transport system substrate-binding protein